MLMLEGLPVFALTTLAGPATIPCPSTRANTTAVITRTLFMQLSCLNRLRQTRNVAIERGGNTKAGAAKQAGEKTNRQWVIKRTHECAGWTRHFFSNEEIASQSAKR